MSGGFEITGLIVGLSPSGFKVARKYNDFVALPTGLPSPVLLVVSL
ncbi:hypothetical protein MYA98_08880 [Salmonella sp. WGH-01]|nr:hypothetical protein MYA98_08880 [Salmonella sp. WGH-01]